MELIELLKDNGTVSLLVCVNFNIRYLYVLNRKR